MTASYGSIDATSTINWDKILASDEEIKLVRSENLRLSANHKETAGPAAAHFAYFLSVVEGKFDKSEFIKWVRAGHCRYVENSPPVGQKTTLDFFNNSLFENLQATIFKHGNNINLDDIIPVIEESDKAWYTLISEDGMDRAIGRFKAVHLPSLNSHVKKALIKRYPESALMIEKIPVNDTPGEKKKKVSKPEQDMGSSGAGAQHAETKDNLAKPALSSGKSSKKAKKEHKNKERAVNVQNSAGLDRVRRPSKKEGQRMFPHPDGNPCGHCGAKESPYWRPGPKGSKTLCNSCGLAYYKSEAKKREAVEKAASMIKVKSENEMSE